MTALSVVGRFYIAVAIAGAWSLGVALGYGFELPVGGL